MQRLLFDTVAARITDSDILSCDWDNSHTATPRSYTMKLPRVRVVQTGTMLGNAAVVQFDPPDFMLKNESSGLHHFDCVPGDCVAWFPFNSSYEVILPREWRRAVASCKLSRADSWGLHGFDCTALRCQVFRNELLTEVFLGPLICWLRLSFCCVSEFCLRKASDWCNSSLCAVVLTFVWVF